MTNAGKYCREDQATDYNMELAHCVHFMPVAIDTHSEYRKTYCFSTATSVVWTSLNVTLFVLYIATLVLHAYRHKGKNKCQKAYEFEVWKRKQWSYEEVKRG
jgi:hypothetical protein